MFRLLRKRREEAIVVGEDEACIHHWMYAPADGPTSIGVCRHCGVSNVAANSLPERGQQSPFGNPAKREGR